MSKFFGKVGFVIMQETAPDVFREETVERDYYGDVTKNVRRYQNTSNLNDDLNVSNTISILADPFAIQNFHALRYVHFMDADWKVTDVEVQYPRLNLTIGGVYNGNKG